MTAVMVQTGSIEARAYTGAGVAWTYKIAMAHGCTLLPSSRDLASWPPLSHGSNGSVLNGAAILSQWLKVKAAPLCLGSQHSRVREFLTGARAGLIWRGGPLQQKAFSALILFTLMTRSTAELATRHVPHASKPPKHATRLDTS
jgi:hypothetical protein